MFAPTKCLITMLIIFTPVQARIRIVFIRNKQTPT
jgi:hypothetical protein